MLSERMSGIDRAWLLMDRPTNPMLIVVLIVLRTALQRDRLRALLAAKFLKFPRFRCLPVNEPLGARWLEAQRFNLEDHIQCVTLPRGAGQPELEALVGELAGTPLHPARPLWAFHLVEHFEGGSALILRIHHCYADGVALLQVLQSMCEPPPGRADRAGSRRAREAHPPAAPAPLPGSLVAALQAGVDLFERGVHAALHPLEPTGPTRLGVDLAAELARLGLMRDDPPTRLKRPLSGVKRIAWTQPLALEEIRSIGRALGCTVNDVLVSVLAGALGRYLESQGDRVSGLTLRAVVPVNLRPGRSPGVTLGNDFGLVFVELPVGIVHPLERLYAVHSAMRQLKASPQAWITLGLLAAVGTLPAAAEQPALALLGAKASLIASNLPGPGRLLRVAGATISQLMFWVPQAGGIGAGVSMLSYAGQVHLGVMADRELIAQPRALVQAMRGEFERLVYLVLLGAGSPAD